MSNRFEIKVCGINDQISMNTALKCNVDYVGLVFTQIHHETSQLIYLENYFNQEIIPLK